MAEVIAASPPGSWRRWPVAERGRARPEGSGHGARATSSSSRCP